MMYSWRTRGPHSPSPGKGLRLPEEALHRHGVLGHAGPEDLDRGRPALGMLGAIDGRGAALADVREELVSGYRAAYEIILAHGRQSKVQWGGGPQKPSVHDCLGSRAPQSAGRVRAGLPTLFSAPP